MFLGPLVWLGVLCGCQSNSPELRIGVISDTQSYVNPASQGAAEMRKCLAAFKDQQIDVLIFGGDISDNGDKRIYQDYQQAMREIFGTEPPETILIMGNHDYWNDMPVAEAQKNFLDHIGSAAINTHKVVNGYDFVGISPEDGDVHGTYTPEVTGKFLDAAMAQAARERPGRPVFVVTHQPPRNTVYGSDDWGNDQLLELLKPYPELVNFSGHTHYSIEDERAIHQRDFTAIGTASLSYCELEAGKVNGTVPPGCGEVRRMLVVDVYPEKLVIHRYPSGVIEELKPDAVWEIPLPLTPENFVYTAAHAATRVAPEFLPGAQASMAFPAVPFDRAVLTLDAAGHPDFVHSYALELQSAEGSQELLFFSDFATGVGRMADQLSFDIPAKFLAGNTAYQARVIPIESFGRRGNGLEFEFTTPERAPIPDEQ